MRCPTDRQQEVLDSIKAYIRHHGMPPTRAEIAEGLGLADASSVSGHLRALARHGRIAIVPHKNRGIQILNDDVPLIGALGEVAAGTPIVCDAHTVERMPAAVRDQFRPRPDFLLTVRGDSMEKVGIRDGDIIAVQRTRTPENGQIVVARFGDEVTLKRFVRIDERHVQLQPESHNPVHETMELDLATHVLHIEGVAVGAVIRGLHRPERARGKSRSHQ